MKKLLSLFAILGLSTLAFGTIETASFGPATTNWATTLSIPQYDGTLTQVDIVFEAVWMGEIKVESLDTQASSPTLGLTATLNLTLPDN